MKVKIRLWKNKNTPAVDKTVGVTTEESRFAEAKLPEEAKAKAENLLAQVNANPASIGMLAMVNSDDQGSKQNGGVYDNVAPKQMVKPFDDFLFGNPVGKTGVVETDFGLRLCEIE